LVSGKEKIKVKNDFNESLEVEKSEIESLLKYFGFFWRNFFFGFFSEKTKKKKKFSKKILSLKIFSSKINLE